MAFYSPYRNICTLPRVEVRPEVDETHIRSSIPQCRHWFPGMSCTTQFDLYREQGRIVRFVSQEDRPNICPMTELAKPL